MLRNLTATAIGAALLFALVACGDDADNEAASETTGETAATTEDGAGGQAEYCDEVTQWADEVADLIALGPRGEMRVLLDLANRGNELRAAAVLDAPDTNLTSEDADALAECVERFTDAQSSLCAGPAGNFGLCGGGNELLTPDEMTPGG